MLILSLRARGVARSEAAGPLPGARPAAVSGPGATSVPGPAATSRGRARPGPEITMGCFQFTLKPRFIQNGLTKNVNFCPGFFFLLAVYTKGDNDWKRQIPEKYFDHNLDWRMFESDVTFYSGIHNAKRKK